MEEKKNNKGLIITLVLAVLMFIAILVVYFVYSTREDKDNNNENNNIQDNNSAEDNQNNNVDYSVERGEIENLFVKTMTIEEMNNYIKNNNITYKCGIDKMSKDDVAISCDEIGEENISYVIDKVAYYANLTRDCQDEFCEESETYYEIYKIAENVQSISVDYTQHHYAIMNVALENGDLYYYIYTFDLSSDDDELFPKEIPFYQFLKVNKDITFVEFVKNIENSLGSTFETITVVKMSDNKLYTIQYDIDKETALLINYNE